MDAATVTVQLDSADLHRFKRYLGNPTGISRRSAFLCLVAVLMFGVAFVKNQLDPGAPHRPGYPHHNTVDSLSEAAPVVLGLGVFVYYLWRGKRPVDYRKIAPHLFLPHTYSVHDEGLCWVNARGEGLNYWSAVTRFVETDQDFFVLLTEKTGHVLPKHCFPNLEAAAIFANQVRLHLEDRFEVRSKVVRRPGEVGVV